MGSRGRNANQGKSRSIKRINPPEDLTPESFETWDEIVNNTPADHFTKSDLPILVAYVEAFTTMRKSLGKLNEQGWVYKDHNGKKHKSQWANILKDSQSIIGLLATKLRLCPSGRFQSTQTTVEVKNDVKDSKRQFLLE